MRIKSVIFFLIYFISLCFSPVLSLAETENAKQQFVRLTSDDKGIKVSFDTSIITYQKDQVQVDLISVVHIAEERYYSELNKRFTGYDALLYELIAEPGVDLTARSVDNKSTITKMQESVKELLGLEFQLDRIDYKQNNFVHADMTPEELMQSMRKKNESVLSMILKLLLHSQEAAGNKPVISPEIFMLQMLLSPNKQMTLRKVLAGQLQNMDTFIEVFEGEEGSSLISGRNQVAIKVLLNQISLGKKKIGIFYGAGHMPDLEKRLLNDLNFKKTSEEWLLAWKLR